MPSVLRIETYADRAIAETELDRLPKLSLPHGLRRKSRFRATLANGTEAALFLPRGSVLRDGVHRHGHEETFAKDESAANQDLHLQQ